jgi:membrane protein YqaA with SNARE-associated domain
MSLQTKLEQKVDIVKQTNSVTRIKKILGSDSGVTMISVISFLESMLPIPILTDPFLVAAILANRVNATKLVLMTTAFSTLGGVFAFVLASVFFDSMMMLLSPDVVAEFQLLVASSTSNIFLLSLIGAVTPVPYTIVAWVVAVLNGSLLIFILASILGRGLRYGIVGYCTYTFGRQAMMYAKRYIAFTSIAVVVLAGLVVWLKM